MNIETVLTRLGVGRLGVRVYTALAGAAGMGVSALCVQSGLHRPSVYRGLAELECAGILIVKNEGKRRKYQTHDSEYIRSVWATDAALTHTDRQTHGTVEVHHGEEAVRAAFDHVTATLPRGDSFYRITSERDLVRVNAFLSPEYRKSRDRKKLERLVISNRASGTQKRSRLERFVRYIGEDERPFDHDVIVLIYAAFVTYIELSGLSVIRIHNEHIADFERSRFIGLYRILPRQ